jgi:pyridoxine kinase
MNKTPRVAAAHDMSGLGRCSLTVILPVLSVMGAQCCPLQTAYLSAHTAFPVSSEAAFCDLTGAMRRTVRHWAELGTEFDATIYRTYTPEMCSLMCLLAEKADLITPNLTEAAILLGEEYENIPHDEAAYRGWLTRLSLRGSRSVVITGATLEPGMVGAASFCRETGEFDFSMDREERGEFSGTGDLFAAVLLGALLRGEKLPAAAARAVAFIRRCAAHTLELGTPLLEGVQFEQLLGGLILQGV